MLERLPQLGQGELGAAAVLAGHCSRGLGPERGGRPQQPDCVQTVECDGQLGGGAVGGAEVGQERGEQGGQSGSAGQRLTVPGPGHQLSQSSQLGVAQLNGKATISLKYTTTLMHFLT